LIRQLDDVTKRRLRMRAAKKGHSMEQEAREILRTSLTSDVRENEHFVDAIRRRIAPLVAWICPSSRAVRFRIRPSLTGDYSRHQRRLRMIAAGAFAHRDDAA